MGAIEALRSWAEAIRDAALAVPRSILVTTVMVSALTLLLRLESRMSSRDSGGEPLREFTKVVLTAAMVVATLLVFGSFVLAFIAVARVSLVLALALVGIGLSRLAGHAMIGFLERWLGRRAVRRLNAESEGAAGSRRPGE
jgi:hypothetical protein